MAGTHQGVNHCNTGTCLARTGRHDKQKVALLFLDTFQYGTDGSNLVVPACNGGIDQLLR